VRGRRIIRTVVGVAAIVAVCGAGAQPANQATLDRILQELQALRARVEAQEKEIAQLKARLEQQQGKQVTQAEVETVVERKLESARKRSPLRLRNNIDSLKVQGDIFFRYETRTADTGKADNPEENRGRLRTRLRLGAVWTDSADKWEIGVGLATMSLT